MLQVLPQNISNLIAAGEVVSRPASVVKELVENAIDAGASKVSVAVTDAGRTQIQVIDDGCGMTPEEAVLCFERHATSKIAAAKDLECILTYGFRGEALASIAAVAEVTLKTRKADSETGTKVEVAESKVKSSEPTVTPVGSNFSIRNLFYNVPARRKFLKSDSAELRNIIQEFIRVALIRPEVALSLTSNGKDIYKLRPAGNLKQRIHDIFGMNLTNELVDLKVDTTVVKIHGFIGNPQDAHKRLGNQFFFVNGRYFRSPFFHKAVCKPYEKLVPQDYTPAYFIFMETEPERIDVNIHPAKTEIKFEDESVVFEILNAAVRESLGKNDFTPSIDFDMRGAPDIPLMPSEDFDRGSSGGTGGFGGWRPQPRIDYSPLFNPFDTPAPEAPDGFGPVTDSYSPVIEPSRSYGALFEEESIAVQTKLLIFQSKYILTPVKSGIMVIDIFRAKERIFYERYLSKLIDDQPLSQQTLFPVTLKLSAEDCIAVLEQPDYVSSLGFDIQDFGGGTIVINAVPEGFSTDDESVRKAVDSLIAALKDDCTLEDQRHAMAAKMAESAAKSGSKTPNQEEAQMLVDQLFACREPGLSPDGHRCTTILTTEELEKKLC